MFIHFKGEYKQPNIFALLLSLQMHDFVMSYLNFMKQKTAFKVSHMWFVSNNDKLRVSWFENVFIENAKRKKKKD